MGDAIATRRRSESQYRRQAGVLFEPAIGQQLAVQFDQLARRHAFHLGQPILPHLSIGRAQLVIMRQQVSNPFPSRNRSNSSNMHALRGVDLGSESGGIIG